MATWITKGYFAGQPHCRGRQLARCAATHYQEIVAEHLYDGKTQLQAALIPLLQEAQTVLTLTPEQRARTIIRVDSGGGTQEDINWVLAQGYQYHGKDYSGKRAQLLAQRVSEWIDDPKCPGRQIGWVAEADTTYVRPVKRIAARCQRANGTWAVGVLVSTLLAEAVLELTRRPCHEVGDPHAVLRGYVYFYDARSGGIETINREDKQALGLPARNKKRKVSRYGLLRMMRDVFTTSGALEFDADGDLKRVTLNSLDPLVNGLVAALRKLFAQQNIAVNSGET